MHYQHFTTHSMRYHDVLINPVLYKSISLMFEKKNHLHLPLLLLLVYLLYYNTRSQEYLFSCSDYKYRIYNLKMCVSKISWLKDKWICNRKSDEVIRFFIIMLKKLPRNPIFCSNHYKMIQHTLQYILCVNQNYLNDTVGALT